LVRDVSSDIRQNRFPVFLCWGQNMARDIELLEAQFTAINRDANELTAGLTEQLAAWRPTDAAWTISECLDHLATTNRVYLDAMEQAADKARIRGKLRRGAAIPGWFGRWFARQLEPPVKLNRKLKSPAKTRPRSAPALAEAYADFMESQRRLEGFICQNLDLDLAGVSFPNPFIRGLRFSLATGIYNILAHDRRHLWQAREVLRSAQRT